MIKIDKLNPFGRMCLSMGMIPSSYAESLTYEEQLIWFCNFLEKQVIPAINNEGLAIEELQNLYTQLKDYVDNYFENLDVQEEINHKLDEMADSGELEEIIGQYLQLAGVLSYNTITNMVNAENIIEGSICYCLGATSYNDGKGGFYKVRTYTTGDIIDDFNIVALEVSDTLIAERMPNYYINLLNKIEDIESNPIYYGADPTGTEDSTTAINNCILANKGKTINFTNGTYLVTSSINLPFKNNEKVSINGNGAKIVASGTITNLFHVGADRTNNEVNDVGFPSYIENLYINCENATVTNAIYNEHGYKDLKLFNLNIYRCLNGVKMGDSSITPHVPCDVLVENCLIYGKGSEYDGVGIIAENTDWNVVMCRIYGFRKGFLINQDGAIDKTQVLLRWENQTGANFDPYERNSETFNTYYEQTMFAEVNTGCYISNSYCDSTYKMLDVKTPKKILLSGSQYFNSRDNVNCDIIDLNTIDNPHINITNCKFYLVKNNSCRIIKTATAGMNNYSNFNIDNIQYENLSRITSTCDIGLSCIPKGHNNINMLANTWYIISCLDNTSANSRCSGNLYINGYPYKLFFEFDGNKNISHIYQINKGSGTNNWIIGCVKYGDTGTLICVKPNSDSNYIKTDFLLQSDYQVNFAHQPINSNDWNESSRLLSDYTNSTPSVTLQLVNVNI